MTIEEVKEHFKDAKKVRCLIDLEIHSLGDVCEAYKRDSMVWINCGGINVLLCRLSYNELAEIIQYKEPKQTKPTHYQTDSIDVIDFCSAYGLNFNRGSATKYIARAGSKTYDGLNTKESELKDLEKAIDFLQREIQTIKNK